MLAVPIEEPIGGGGGACSIISDIKFPVAKALNMAEMGGVH